MYKLHFSPLPKLTLKFTLQLVQFDSENWTEYELNIRTI